MRHRYSAWVFATVTLLGVALAQANEPRLTGVFINDNPSDAAIKAAIDQAAKEFNFVIRPIARNRMKHTNPLIKRMVLTQQSGAISVTTDKSNACVVTPGMPPIKWKRDDGEVFDTSMAWHGNVLAHTFVAPDGTRTTRYVLSPDGATLTLQVTVTSPQLKAPLRYELTLKRTNN